MNSDPDLTITIVSYNTRGLLRDCLKSLQLAVDQYKTEVHVIDNASSDGSPDMVQGEFPEARLIVNPENVGFARANNQSWYLSRGRYWLLMNSDAEARAGSIDALVQFMDSHPRAGMASARLVSSDGSLQHCAQPDPSIARTLIEAARLHKLLPAATRARLLLGPYWNYSAPTRVGWTWGTALIARREAIEQCGPLSDAFFMYGEDLEWCLRMRRRGWEVWFCSAAEVLHHGGQSPVGGVVPQDRLRARLDGIYRAVATHRGDWYAIGLQATALLALTVEWITARIRRRSRDALSAPMSYYRDRLGRAFRHLFS